MIDAFMLRNPAVEQYMKEVIEEARFTGCAFTILGRRRSLQEIVSPNQYERYRAERQAGNLPIQGTAADAAKMAMILIDEADLETKYGCRMLLQIHDELIFECPEETADAAMEEIRVLVPTSRETAGRRNRRRPRAIHGTPRRNPVRTSTTGGRPSVPPTPRDFRYS
jgi:DNA polymerase I-like protein with 3'-5' exonuclease and polymerase domains